MSAPTVIRVVDFAGGPFAVSVEDGERLCGRIAPMLRAGIPVTLSFAGIEVCVGAFLSAVVWPLCAEFSMERIVAILNLSEIMPDDRAAVEHAMRNARAYHANPAAYDAAWEEEFDVQERVTTGDRP